MAEYSGFFPDVDGDREYNTDFLAQWIASIVGNGVYNGTLAVTAGDHMQVVIPAGKAWINGYHYRNDGNLPLAIANADGILNRKDTVVLRWDVNGRSITAQVLTGTPASSPTAPGIIRTAEQYDLKLAEISIPAGTTAVTQALITDTRLNNSVCGIVTGAVDQVDTTTLYNQIQADLAHFRSVNEAEYTEWSTEQQANYEEWFDGIKGILGEDEAGNLLNMIQAHEADTVAHVTQADHDKINGAVQGNTKAWVATEVAMADNNYAFQLTIPNFVFSEGCQVTFKAPAAPIDSYFSYLSISGVQYSLRTLSQDAITSEAWKANTTVTVSLSTVQINLGDNGRSGTAFFSGASSVQTHNTSQGKLVVSVIAYDGESIGDTKVRIQNASLGMDLSYTPDALGKVTVQLVGNKTYSISLISVPDPYYGEATSQYIGFDTENSLTLLIKDQPDIIGVQINMTTGETTYTDGAADWVPMSMNGETLEVGSWENSWLVKDIRPCLLKDGVVQYYLKKTGFMQYDYSLKENGDPSDITTGADGDVMIEIPRFYMEVSTVSVLDTNYLKIRFSKEKVSNSFEAKYFFGDPVRDSLYIAAYRGYSVDTTSLLLSVSGKTPTSFTVANTSSNDPVSALNQYISTKYTGATSVIPSDISLLYQLYIMLFRTHIMNAYGYRNSVNVLSGLSNNRPLCYMDVGEFKFLGIENPFYDILCPVVGQINSYTSSIADQYSTLYFGLGQQNHSGGQYSSDIYFENFHSATPYVMPNIDENKTSPTNGKMGIHFRCTSSASSNRRVNALWRILTENNAQLTIYTNTNYRVYNSSTSDYSYYGYSGYRHFKFLEPLS